MRVCSSRSLLFAPGNHERRVGKALDSVADVVLLDLEDAVPAAEKAAARAIVARALMAPRASGRAYVRINPLGSADYDRDLEAIGGCAIDGIVLPKADGAPGLRAVDESLTVLERDAGLPKGSLDLMPIVETAAAVWNCDAIAAATSRVRRLIFGAADYTLDLDLEWTAEEHELLFARARIAHASRIAGIEPPIDTAILQVRDTARFVQSARTGRRMGFQGKLCLHPDQVGPCNEVFTPSRDDIERARRVVAAFDAAQEMGSAAIELDGRFIDQPVALHARRVLQRAGQAEE